LADAVLSEYQLTHKETPGAAKPAGMLTRSTRLAATLLGCVAVAAAVSAAAPAFWQTATEADFLRVAGL